MPYEGQGCFKSVPQKKIGFVYICDPVDYPIHNESEIFPQDMEQTLVHELVHLTMNTWERSEPDSLTDVLVEQTVDQLAKAFIKVKRNGGEPPLT